MSIKNLVFPIKLLTIFICFSLVFNSVTPYDRLKNGDITGCAFYNAESYTILKFKTGSLTFTRWSGMPGSTNQYKIEEYNMPYSYYKPGMSGSINGIQFIILNRTAQNKPNYYLTYNGVTYALSTDYSD
ncbi:hypothetical protein [uncultured Mucilaginibacter sp.]|uniref:hypothetical protein n=1 Tax=uncultured Mucilaginibacter sp. TaxID=797541 RepID=UPI0025EFEAD9|nr:hypothetical protein [uncultured Mucilaginibacter sp.]